MLLLDFLKRVKDKKEWSIHLIVENDVNHSSHSVFLNKNDADEKLIQIYENFGTHECQPFSIDIKNHSMTIIVY